MARWTNALREIRRALRFFRPNLRRTVRLKSFGLSALRTESGRGLPHSKTLRDAVNRTNLQRSWSAAVLCRFCLKLFGGAFRQRQTLLPLSFLFLIACARVEERPDFVIANGAEPESLDPAVLTGQVDGRIAAAMFEGLTRFNAVDAHAEPALAERWEISPDALVYTFHLRTNAVWSTGEPITADDVVYSWRRVANPETACDYAGLLYYVKNGEEISRGKIKDLTQLGAKALDARTLRVELTQPIPFFLDICAWSVMRV